MFHFNVPNTLRLAASQAQSLIVRQCAYRHLHNFASPSKVLTSAVSQHTRRKQLQTHWQPAVINQQTRSFCGLSQHSLTASLWNHSVPKLMPLFLQQGQVRHYMAVLKPRLVCQGCYFVWRHGRKHVECSDHPRHKQMKMVATRKVWQEDYTKGATRSAMELYRIVPRQKARMADRTSVSHNWLAGRLGRDL